MRKINKNILLLLLGGGVFVTFFLILFWPKKFSSTYPPAIRPTATPVSSIRVSPTVSWPAATMEKINISEVQVNNFYRNPVKINPIGDALIADNSKFQIVYLPKFDKFIISILSSPFPEIKIEAEEELLRILGIDRQSACRLNTEVATSYSVNPDYAQDTYPLSFCK